MRYSKYYSGALLLSIILFFVCCNSKFSLMKGRYNKGITFVTHSKHKPEIQKTERATESLPFKKVSLPKTVYNNDFICNTVLPSPEITSKSSLVKEQMLKRYFGNNDQNEKHHNTKSIEYKFDSGLNKKSDYKNQSVLLSTVALTLLASALIAFFQRNKFKKLSGWARRNPSKSRVLLAGIGVAGFFNSAHIGEALLQSGINLPENFFNYSVIAMALGVLFHPFKKQGIITQKITYYKSKISIGLIACASSAMIIGAANKHISFFDSNWKLEQTINYKALTHFSSLSKEDKNIDKSTSSNSFLSVSNDEDTTGEQALYIIGMFFSILFAIAAILAAIIFACYFICTGQEGLAILVGVGGAGLATFLIVLAIRLGNELHDLRKKNKV